MLSSMGELFDEATTRILRSASSQLPVTSPTVTVVAVEGPNAGLRVTFDDLAHRQVFVGQSSTCDVRLADKTVSRRHLGLRVSDRGVVIEDLESSNGTTVNGVLVDRAVLVGGEVVRIGSSGFRIEVGAERRPLAASDAANFGGFIGASNSARRLYLVLERFAQLETPLLLEGEAGTGKELLAETIHEVGPRAGGPFVVLERARGDTPLVVERALFGHEANGERQPGLLERAQGGTMFIDEAADLEPPVQIKLLRALESRAARRVDGSESYAIDVRFIVATRRNLDRDVHARRFREELLAFLAPGRVTIPALRHRRGDVTLLTKFFWTKFGGDQARLSPALLQRFEEHRWPGNVRELIAAIARQLVETSPRPRPEDAVTDEIQATADASDGDDFIHAILRRALPFATARQHVAADFETRYLKYMLDLHGGNVTKAAGASGISRRHYYRLRAKR
jgi:DNA-binding NtrC family response regulator